MEIVNLLEYLNKLKDLYTLDFSTCTHDFVNILDLITEDEQFIQKIDLGLIYVKSKTLDQVLIVDGLIRVLSLSLLLHAVCECYKKTSPKNENAIKTIRSKYLLNGNKTKLRLPESAQIVYDKILFGEILSGKEKDTPMFKLLHSYWSTIKENKLQAAKIFKMLKKIYVVIVEAEKVSSRDLYYNLNRERREIKPLSLIEDYLSSIGLNLEWKQIKNIYNNKSSDINMFLKDFFITKINFKDISERRMYEVFVNYFETMLQYMSDEVLINKIKRSAHLYSNILNINIENDAIKRALIQIKMHDGEDTYAYILSIYEDYIDNNLSEATFLEILSTINEYLRNRIKSPSSVSFNELINYLNAFITCK